MVGVGGKGVLGGCLGWSFLIVVIWNERKRVCL